MGNRAVITQYTKLSVDELKQTGIYLHWNGGKDSVQAFLTYCKMKGYRSPEIDSFGWARLAQVIANFFGGDGLGIGIDTCDRFDCDNNDNGVYLISDWEIVGRQFFKGEEQTRHDMYKMILDIDKAQPRDSRIGKAAIDIFFKK